MQTRNTVPGFARKVALPLVGIPLGTGCSAPAEIHDTDGEAITAVILSPGVIRSGDRELPLDVFLHETRKRVEAAGPSLDRAIRVRLLTGPEMKDSPSVVKILEALNQIGVRFIELGSLP
jgi:hypothetical protein